MAKELEHRLLLQAQQHKAAACAALVAHYEKPVFSLLWRMLSSQGKEDIVEDLAQETFLRVFRALPSFRIEGTARLSTWILTIATRLALNELRRKTRAELSSRPLPDPVEPTQTDELVRQKMFAKSLELAIAGLSSDYRAVFLLAEYHEQSHIEIAEALSIRVGTVKSRLSRARRFIREQLSEYFS